MIKDKQAKIFISHSTKDKSYVKEFVKMLQSAGLHQQLIFCSSLPGYDIPINNNIFDYLREQFLVYNLHVIFIHSVNYYKSCICLNEMGAAWALKTNYTSILIPGCSFSDMKGVVNNSDISIKLDSDIYEVKDKLNQLKQNLFDEFNLAKGSEIIWEQARDLFISSVSQICSENNTERPNAKTQGATYSMDNDLELTEEGYYIKKSEEAAGKMIRYCVACYQNYGKLYPFTQGSMRRDLFCSNCKARIDR